MVDFKPIQRLLRAEPNLDRHPSLPEENIFGLKQVDGGCNRAVYKLRKQQPSHPIQETRHHEALHRPSGTVYKVNRGSIPASEERRMRDCLKFLADHYDLLREISSSKGLNILPFNTELIPDRNGNLRVVYAEPDVGRIFKDPRIIDLAHARIYSSPRAVLSDDRALASLSNIVDLSRQFYYQTKKAGRPMYPDIWGENNVLGIKAPQLLTEYSLNLNNIPKNSGYPLLGNSSLLKANDSHGLFNERPDFQLVISSVLGSMQRLIDQKSKSVEQRALHLDPIQDLLFQLAHMKTRMNQVGVNF